MNKLTPEIRTYLVGYAVAMRADGVDKDDVIRKMVEQEGEERHNCYLRPPDAIRIVEISRMETSEERERALADEAGPGS